MWPKGLWTVYERAIRRLAGLGTAPTGPDPDRYGHVNAHCDVLVAGGGPAGLATALAAGRAGARVILADREPALGGALLAESEGAFSIDGRQAAAWVASAEDALSALAEVRILTRTTVFAYYDHNFVCLLEHPDPVAASARQRLWKVRAKRLVLAAGALERPMVFADNDRPGIMLAGAARAYLNRYGVKPGDQAVIFTNNDDAYRTAIDLAAAGVAVEAVVDVRQAGGALSGRARDAGIPVLAASAIVATRGRHRVRGVTVMALGDETVAGPPRELACDLVCVSGGWNPTVNLLSQSRGRVRYRPEDGVFVPGTSVQAERSAGACNGTFTLAGCLAEGARAGLEAARAAGFDGLAETPPAVGRARREAPARALEGAVDSSRRQEVRRISTPTSPSRTWSWRCARATARSSTSSATPPPAWERTRARPATFTPSASSPTRSAPTWPISAPRPSAPPTPRSPSAPWRGATWASLFDPVRRTPMHGWHEDHGARFEDVGQWQRAWYYPKAGETMEDAVRREVGAARASIGILDYSTLGKIDIAGPDAVRLLDRVYTNAWAKLPVGRARYGLMLGEDGMVMDDGVTLRLAENHFLMTTTTGNAAVVLFWLEEWLQTEWPEFQVYLTSVSEQWATVSLCGPNARALLAGLTEGIALGADAFPPMTMREGRVAGIPARLLRVSFTGELSFEINVRASHGLALWEALIAAGADHGITPYGTEAMHVLRAEKGFIIVGQETDGSVTPIDLGMDWIVSKSKPDFIGKRSLARSAMAPRRPQATGRAHYRRPAPKCLSRGRRSSST